MEHLKDVKINLKDLYHLRYMRFRFGKISKANYSRIQEDIKDLKTIVLEVEEDEQDLWLMYLTTDNYSKEVDSFFNIAKFERI